jgi:hypothetical protein
MGKRSDFPRRPHDDYETPAEAVAPLLPFLDGVERFAEPCAGRGHLIVALESAGLECVYAAELRTGINPPSTRIAEGVDALAVGRYAYQAARAQRIITNPPWTRQLLHPLIWHLCGIMPAWLLFDADWVHTKQSGALIRHCSTIVSVGRVRWIAGSKSTGKDNAAWHLFDRRHVDGPRFVGRTARESDSKKLRDEVAAC